MLEPIDGAGLISVRADANRVDLQDRVASRKRELVAELIEHKQRTGVAAVEVVDALRRRLTQLEQLIKQNVLDGWGKVSVAGRAEFELWIDQ